MPPLPTINIRPTFQCLKFNLRLISVDGNIRLKLIFVVNRDRKKKKQIYFPYPYTHHDKKRVVSLANEKRQKSPSFTIDVYGFDQHPLLEDSKNGNVEKLLRREYTRGPYKSSGWDSICLSFLLSPLSLPLFARILFLSVDVVIGDPFGRSV